MKCAWKLKAKNKKTKDIVPVTEPGTSELRHTMKRNTETLTQPTS